MVKFIAESSKVVAAGTKEKIIDEFVGRVNTQTDQVSIAWMHSPEGWCEPIQTPEFDEYTLVIKGMLQVSTPLETYEVRAGQCLSRNVTNLCNTAPQKKMEAEYISICIPAFSVETVHRQE